MVKIIATEVFHLLLKSSEIHVYMFTEVIAVIHISLDDYIDSSSEVYVCILQIISDPTAI